jgi:predicted transcriptional regulator of viral defense system
MGDMIRQSPDFPGLFETASSQHGHFTAAQAHDHGYSDSLLSYHAKTGTFVRVHRGVYRLRDYPNTAHEAAAAAWLAVGKERAVLSHESALELLELSDVVPRAIHLTVPRSVRNLPRLKGVKIHTTSRELGAADATTRDGIRTASVPRAIVDAAEHGTSPEQVGLAIAQALRRNLTTPKRLEQAAAGRSQRVRALVQQAIGASNP